MRDPSGQKHPQRGGENDSEQERSHGGTVGWACVGCAVSDPAVGSSSFPTHKTKSFPSARQLRTARDAATHALRTPPDGGPGAARPHGQFMEALFAPNWSETPQMQAHSPLPASEQHVTAAAAAAVLLHHAPMPSHGGCGQRLHAQGARPPCAPEGFPLTLA